MNGTGDTIATRWGWIIVIEFCTINKNGPNYKIRTVLIDQYRYWNGYFKPSIFNQPSRSNTQTHSMS
jgi:hypothetical protein